MTAQNWELSELDTTFYEFYQSVPQEGINFQYIDTITSMLVFFSLFIFKKKKKQTNNGVISSLLVYKVYFHSKIMVQFKLHSDPFSVLSN